jgi:putative ABC transport system permease protein
MEILLQDLHYGFRRLIKNPGFTATAVLALALGIGASSAIFSVVNAILLRPLPFKDSDKLIMVWGTQPQLDTAPFSPADFLDLRDQNQVFEHIAAYKAQSLNLTGADEPERIRGAVVSASFLSLLKAEPILGRGFLPDEEQVGKNQVVVVSHGLWQRRFGSNPSLVGQTLTLNAKSYLVVGISSPDYQFPSWADVWVPLAFDANETKLRDTHYLNVIARLKPEVSRGQAQAEMDIIAGRLEQEHPASNTGIGVRLISLQEQIVGGIGPSLLVLLGAVGFVLLIACANVANMLLARSAARQREMSIRTALGASRPRVVRQLLTESVLLAFIGGALGLLIAHWGVKLLIAVSPGSIPRVAEIGIDGRVLVVTLVLSVLTGVIFGLAPALQVSKPDLNVSLKEGGRSSTQGGGRRSLHSLLVVFEIALALVLLIGAGLMMRSFLRLQEVNPGFDPKNALTMQIALPKFKYPDVNHRAAFFQQVLERMKTLPGVQSVGAITGLPLSGNNSSTSFLIEGRESPAALEKPLTEYRTISPDYFRAMGIALLKGRDFSSVDHENAPGVVIINETMARRFFPNEDPIGKHLGLSGPPDWREIVGVVGDVKEFGLDAEPKPESYIPYLQSKPSYLEYTSMVLVIRTGAEPKSIGPTLRGVIQAVDKDQPVYNVKTMDQYLSESISQQHFNALLLITFGIVAIVLATIGVYGLMAYSVAQRTHEIGIRMALGAQHSDVLKLVVGQGMVLGLIGVTVGLIASFALTGVMSSLLYQISATDPITFIGLPLLLVAVVLVASYIPAHRATKIDPIIALRYE